MNSYLCEALRKAFNKGINWKEYFQKIGLDKEIKWNEEKVSNGTEERTYTLFKYIMGAHFDIPEVSEARGIVIDTTDISDPKVLCRPFNKFFKYNDRNYKYAPVDYKDAQLIFGKESDHFNDMITLKVDGTLCNLWYSEFEDTWRVSTTGRCDGRKAELLLKDGVENIPFNNYGDCFFHVINQYIDYDKLDKECTYMFEYCAPWNRVVIKYDSEIVYLLAVRNNKTGFYQEHDINKYLKDKLRYKPEGHLENVPVELMATLYTNDDDFCQKIAEKLDLLGDNKYHGCHVEGLVLRDRKYNQVKIKSPIYLILHSLFSDNEEMRQGLIELLWNDRIDLASFEEDFAEYMPRLYYYTSKVGQFKKDVIKYIRLTQWLYVTLGRDRAELGKIIQDDILASFAWQFLETTIPDEEILKSIPSKRIVKYIPKYQTLVPDFKERFRNAKICLPE